MELAQPVASIFQANPASIMAASASLGSEGAVFREDTQQAGPFPPPAGGFTHTRPPASGAHPPPPPPPPPPPRLILQRGRQAPSGPSLSQGSSWYLYFIHSFPCPTPRAPIGHRGCASVWASRAARQGPDLGASHNGGGRRTAQHGTRTVCVGNGTSRTLSQRRHEGLSLRLGLVRLRLQTHMHGKTSAANADQLLRVT